MIPEKTIARFEEKISHEPNTGCWLWIGAANHAGYGKLKVEPRQQPRAAHRVSWEIYVGEIPDGACVLHKCDTPACVNPRHLFVGSLRDNSRDMMAKGRQRFGLKAGHLPHTAKLSAQQVVEIRKKRATGTIYRHLANEYGVTIAAIRFACIGKTWASVPQ